MHSVYQTSNFQSEDARHIIITISFPPAQIIKKALRVYLFMFYVCVAWMSLQSSYVVMQPCVV